MISVPIRVASAESCATRLMPYTKAALKITTKSVVVSIHSFTSVYKGEARAVELGILHDRDRGLADKLITSFPTVDARLNEPYGPDDGVLHTLKEMEGIVEVGLGALAVEGVLGLDDGTREPFE